MIYCKQHFLFVYGETDPTLKSETWAPRFRETLNISGFISDIFAAIISKLSDYNPLCLNDTVVPLSRSPCIWRQTSSNKLTQSINILFTVTVLFTSTVGRSTAGFVSWWVQSEKFKPPLEHSPLFSSCLFSVSSSDTSSRFLSGLTNGFSKHKDSGSDSEYRPCPILHKEM